MLKLNLQYFGGRGASSGKAKAMTLQEFLNKKGVGDISSGWSNDKLRSNKDMRTAQGQKRFFKQQQEAENEYQDKREKAIREYNRLVDAGKIRDKTPIERKLDIARGNSDLEATQAARRVLAKKGIDWRTGRKLK